MSFSGTAKVMIINAITIENATPLIFKFELRRLKKPWPMQLFAKMKNHACSS